MAQSHSHVGFRPARPRWLVTVCLSMCLLSTATGTMAQPIPTQVSAYDEVGRLLRSGQLDEAQKQIDRHLSDKAGDPQMRFLKGVLQSQRSQTEDAQATFVALTQDYPELPEPYNNLAVLYAAQNRLDEARQALETAVRLNPSYATAYQNLGDVYARLASTAYSRSLQLDPSNPVIRPRVQALESLLQPSATNR